MGNKALMTHIGSRDFGAQTVAAEHGWSLRRILRHPSGTPRSSLTIHPPKLYPPVLKPVRVRIIGH